MQVPSESRGSRFSPILEVQVIVNCCICVLGTTLWSLTGESALHLKSPQADWEDVLVIEGFRVWIATTRVKHLHICKPNRPGVGTGECL